MDVVVTGRHCEIAEGFRTHAADKLARLEKHDHRIMRVHVEVDCEPNPRQHDRSVHVELTAFSRGPVIRAEAAADDKMGALDLAVDKMAAQMRKAADRRRIHRRRGRTAPAAPLDGLVDGQLDALSTSLDGVDQDQGGTGDDDPRSSSATAGLDVEGDGPLVVRVKSHAATPMSLDQALYEMELVGHDFYLFVDQADHKPSVVYRRRGYDYGVISLDLDAAGEPEAADLVGGPDAAMTQVGHS